MNHPQPQPPWQPQEKLELLTEVIRQSRVAPEALVQFIISHGIQPNWGDTPLPQRRSVNQCMAVYDDMMRSRGGLMRSTSVRELGPPTAMKRPFFPEAANYGGRMIQPRPEGAPLVSPGESSEPPKKKRGRPTKAEAEERRQAAIARGDPYPTPRRGSVIGAVAGPSTAAPGPSTAAPARPPSARPPSVRPPSIAAAQAALGVVPRIVRTPPPQSGPPSSESSSGKRRRGRPTRAEEESRRAQESFTTARGRGPSRYPDILSRDEPIETHQPRPKPASTQPPQPHGPEPPGPR